MAVRRAKRRHDPETPKPCSSSRCPRASLHASPECTVNVSDRCVGSGWTSRWYHVSTSEHYCNECFELAYRSHFSGDAYIEWQTKWAADCRLDPTMKVFFAEQIIPFWLRCKDCGKWRKVNSIDIPVTGSAGKCNVPWASIVNEDNTMKDFVCGQFANAENPESCSTPEADCVKDATGVFWLADLGYLPFLLSSPATAMLRAYFPDGVGVSPVGVWKWSGIRSRPVPTPAQRSTTEVKAEFCSSTSDTGTCSTSSVGSASSAQPVLTTTAPTIPPPQAAGTGLASTLVIKKPIQSSPRRPTSSYRPSRRHLGKHGGPGRAKAKQQNDDDSSDDEEVNRKFGYFQPFHRPGREGKARSFRPDTMEPAECRYFPEFSTLKNPTLYLGLRNLVLALWNSCCTEPLSVDRVMQHVLIRGLVRVRCYLEVGRILAFLTRHAFVNCGFLNAPLPELPRIAVARLPRQLAFPRWTSESGSLPFVLVIGAGPAGLSAAFHLQRLGAKVKVVEARDRIGGRVCDDTTLGTCIGRGAQIVNGCINNPMSVLCKQAGFPMRRLSGQCVLIDENGMCAESSDDEHVEQFFNALLDLVGDWRLQQLAEAEKVAQAAHANSKPLQKANKRSRQKSTSRRSSIDERRNAANSGASTPNKCTVGNAASGPSDGTCAVNLQVLISTTGSASLETTTPVTGGETSAGDVHTAEARPTGITVPTNGAEASPPVSARKGLDSTSTRNLLSSPVVSSTGIPSPASPTAVMLQDLRQQHSPDQLLVCDKPVDQVTLSELLEKAKTAFSSLTPNGGLPECQDRLLDFHLGNLEYSCGSVLDEVSAMNWDQNEHFPQFLGDHTVMVEGFSPIFEKIAETLDIQLNKQVVNVDYSDSVVKVATSDGDILSCDFALVTAPLSLLKRKVIDFSPPLPERKQEAIDRLGAGLIEKVALRFPCRFWSAKVKGGDFFGHVPTGPEHRGLCGIFYDLSSEKVTGDGGILMTIVSGKSLGVKRNCTSAELVEHVMALLRAMFPEETVPAPSDYFVSSWADDPWAGMSYSYMAAGSSGSDYEHLAEPVLNRVMFAGEATNRHHPQTVTGAYLSGIREAARIADIAL